MRLDRAILKMRLERAFLLERLAERMAPNVDDSDRSTSPPPTVGHTSPPLLAKDAKSDVRRSQPQEKPTRGKRTHRQKTPPLEGHQSGSLPPHHSPGSTSNTAQHHTLHPLQAMSSAHSTPDPGRPSSGVPYGNTSIPTGLNGTQPSTPFSGSAPPTAGGGAPGLPLPQPHFGGGDDRERQRSAENGGPGSDYGAPRPFAPGAPTGATGEPLSAGPSIRTDVNGERRIAPPSQDTEMGEADAAAPSQADSQDAEGQGGLGMGFTAVNR